MKQLLGGVGLQSGLLGIAGSSNGEEKKQTQYKND